VAEHRRAVIDAASVLLKSGAHPDGDPRSIPLAILSGQMLKTLPMQRLEAGNLDNAGFRKHLDTTGHLFELTTALFQLLLFHEADPNVTGSRDTRTLACQVVDIAMQTMEKQEHLRQVNALDQFYGQCWLDYLTRILTMLLVSGAIIPVDMALITLFWRAAACNFPAARRFIHVILASLDECRVHELKMRLCLEDILTVALIERQRGYNAQTKPGMALQWISEVERPRRLKCLARGAIINAMKTRSLCGVSTLGLPSLLEQYVLILSD